MKTICLAVVLLALLGDQVTTAASAKRRPLKVRFALGDPEADALVDSALAYVTSQMTGTLGLDPSAIDEDILGLNATGSITGLSNLVRTTEAEFHTAPTGTTMVWEFSVETVVANFVITSDSDSTVSGVGVAEINIEPVECTATEQSDGSYYLTVYQPVPITTDDVTVIVTGLGDFSDYSDDISAYLGSLIVEDVNVAIGTTVLGLLDYALITGATA
jgi:hypothetical protein